jgi:hypothetical protein
MAQLYDLIENIEKVSVDIKGKREHLLKALDILESGVANEFFTNAPLLTK